MAYGLRDTFGTSISDDYGDDYGVISGVRSFMARSRNRKKTSNVRRKYKLHSTKKKVVHRRGKKRVSTLSRGKKRPYPHHLKKYWFKKKRR